MSKLNPELPVILIDTSYWLYYRFFSLRNWYARAYPDNYINKTTTDTTDTTDTTTNNFNKNFNIEHNWLEDEIFMTKYKKLFVENIKKICKKFKTKMENVVFCIDCPHNTIWRHTIINTENEKQKIENEKQKIENEKQKIENEKQKIENENNNDNDNIKEKLIEPIMPIELIEPYKGTRLESHKKNKFNSFNIFSYMKTKFIPTLKDNNNNNVKIINCPKCEADDIIGQLTLYIHNLYIEKQWQLNTIYILANDNDYLQVCNNNIKLINGIGKIISGEQGVNKMGDKYLLSKILCGDRSDNIKCCDIDNGYLHSGIPNKTFKNISKNGIEKLISNPEKYNVFITLLNEIRNNKLLNDIENKHIININKFKHNCIMMDFQMIPVELKENLYKLFREII
jgi:hypothetical protein